MANYVSGFGFYTGTSPPPPPLAQTPFNPVASSSPCRDAAPSPLAAPYCGGGSGGVPGVPVPAYEATPSPYATYGVAAPANIYPTPIATSTNAYIKDSDPWRGLSPAHSYYDATFTYGYSSTEASFELQATRRKNVTRDSTSTLKAWLNEHKKNPYPSKGEKIMLAIITKMTLTQVSTWFANARRRLKKENKMTWEPRNKCDFDNDLTEDPQQPERFHHHATVVESSLTVPPPGATAHLHMNGEPPLSYGSSGPLSGGHLHLATLSQPPLNGDPVVGDCPSSTSQSGDSSSTHSSTHSPKPRPGKIWSLADTATKRQEQLQQQHGHLHAGSAWLPSAATAGEEGLDVHHHGALQAGLVDNSNNNNGSNINDNTSNVPASMSVGTQLAAHHHHHELESRGGTHLQ